MSQTQENSDSDGVVVDVCMKVVDSKTKKILFDSGKLGFQSTAKAVRLFLKEHEKDLSSDFSGYAGDISSEGISDPKTGNKGASRLTFGSTISTIPQDSSSPIEIPSSVGSSGRPSTVSSISDTGRILTSTRIEDHIVVSEKVMSSSKVNANCVDTKHLLSNGNGTDSGDAMDNNKVESDGMKKGKGKGRGSDQAGGKGRKRKQNDRSVSESSSEKLESSAVKQEVKRPRKSEEAFDSPSAEELGSLFGSSTTSSSLEDGIQKNENGKGSTQFVPTAATGSREMAEEEAASLVKSATLWGRIAIDEWVFARWRDKNYYSGQIIAKGMNDTWQIHFEDNMDDVASETHILPIRIIGVNVKAVYSPDNIYRPSLATVIGQKFSEDGQHAEYAIKCDDLSHPLICQRKQLSLKESEAKALRKVLQAPVPKAADLNFDNIVSGPRRRGSEAAAIGSGKKIVGGAFDASSADEHVLRDSGVGTPTPKKPVASKPASVTKTASSTSSASDSGLSDSKHTIVSDTGPSLNQVATPATPKPATSKDASSVETPKGTLKDSVKKTGKTKSKSLFDSMQFFLTASGGGDPASSGNEVPLTALPYDKDEYRESIETRGGKVVDVVGKEHGKDNVFLISDSHARTVKYIYCLAAGIPCVSHLWLGECLKTNSIVDWKPYELKSGWSLEKQEVIPAHNKKPLKNLKIFVTSETDELYNYWKPVLTAAEASLLKPKKKSGAAGNVPPNAEVVVTDSSCTEEFYDKVSASNIPLVMPEWLVQSIITGEKASYTGHERYKVNIGTEEDE